MWWYEARTEWNRIHLISHALCRCQLCWPRPLLQWMLSVFILHTPISGETTSFWGYWGQRLKWFCEAGAHLTKPGWSKPHSHSNPTNLALFRQKITLFRFNQGAHTAAGGGAQMEAGVLTPQRPLTLNTDWGSWGLGPQRGAGAEPVVRVYGRRRPA